MKKISLVLLFSLFILIAVFYHYCYISDHLISSVTHESLIDKKDKYILTSECRAVSFDTFAPYVSVQVNNFKVLTTAVNAGYDTLGDCMKSSIERLQFIESEGKVQIYMKNGQVKEISIIYNSK